MLSRSTQTGTVKSMTRSGATTTTKCQALRARGRRSAEVSEAAGVAEDGGADVAEVQEVRWEDFLYARVYRAVIKCSGCVGQIQSVDVAVDVMSSSCLFSDLKPLRRTFTTLISASKHQIRNINVTTSSKMNAFKICSFRLLEAEFTLNIKVLCLLSGAV